VTEDRFKSYERPRNDNAPIVEFHDGKGQPNQLTVNPNPAWKITVVYRKMFFRWRQTSSPKHDPTSGWEGYRWL